jgi:serine/threonine-protein kinase RsbT
MITAMSLNATDTEVSSAFAVSVAVEKVKYMARELGFSECEQTKIAVATSELAMNILLHAQGKGKITIKPLTERDKVGIMITAEDKGLGIADVQKALQGIVTSKKGLGVGLGGAKRLMDEFEIKSKVGEGTTITAKKWKDSEALQKETNWCQ